MWYKLYGWKENPFYVKSSPLVLGLEEEKKKLINYIYGGNICSLNGPSGIGKTSLLKWIKENLRNHTIIYIDAESINEFFDLFEYIKKHKSFFEFYRIFPKNTVILLDEANVSDENLKKALKIQWEEGLIKSIVISQIPILDNFSPAFKARIGERKIELEKMPLTEIYNLINKRTKKKNPFTEDALALIAEEADYVPRKILELCERVCIDLSEKGKKEISAFDIESILNKKSKTEIIEDINTDEILENIEIEKPIIKKSDSLSPMQQRIISLLKVGSKTTQELASLLNTTEGSIGKQLSQLSLMNKVKVVDDKRPKKYGLA